MKLAIFASLLCSCAGPVKHITFTKDVEPSKDEVVACVYVKREKSLTCMSADDMGLLLK